MDLRINVLERLMRLLLRWLVSGFALAVLHQALTPFLPSLPLAAHWLGFVTLLVLVNVCLAWNDGGERRSLVIALGVGFMAMAATLALAKPGPGG